MAKRSARTTSTGTAYPRRRRKANHSGAKDVDTYIGRVPEPARSTLKKIRTAIRAATPPETTETISYGIPSFKYQGYLVGYAAFSAHCSLFPGAAALRALKKELKNYATAKGTIKFPIDEPPPAALIKKLVKARLAQDKRRKRE